MSTTSLYHALPHPLRCVVASARGTYLAAWRYSSATDRLVEEILARETWSPARWQAWQEEELARLLDRAVRAVPWYRAHWERRRRHGDRRPTDILANWPVLEKEDVRRNPDAFVADHAAKWRMHHIHTSGTTGKPVRIWQSRPTLQRQYALMEARWRLWNGVSRRDRWAIIGGQLVTPVAQKRPPFWVWNAGLRQLYMSSLHLSIETAPQYGIALRQHGVRYLWGYSSSLHALADGLIAHDMRPSGIEVVISNAEALLPNQRAAIERAFGCPVIETYGMSEAVLSAGQCRHATLHLWPESGVLEVLENQDGVPAGATGEFVATGLNNAEMPLIRYRTGDRGALPAGEERCMCGRTLPGLARIEGRSDDTFIAPGGRRVGRLDPVFKANLPVREAQIIQESLTRLRVLCVPSEQWTPAAERVIVQRIHDRMGDVEILCELVKTIPRGPNGKFRAMICRLSPQQKREAFGNVEKSAALSYAEEPRAML